MRWTAIERAIGEATGASFSATAASPVPGGSINEAVRLDGSSGSYFVKLNQPAMADMFAAEAAGLADIRATGAIRTPRPVCRGEGDGRSWLVLEFIEPGDPHDQSSQRLGEQLAALHRHTADRFGWHRDNYIGSTPQPNGASDDWAAFFGERRLQFQLDLARDNGAPAALVDAGSELVAALPAFFGNYRPVPSLLHGDLWGGNWACDTGGSPVIFDPAVYFGDRETDLAMTELFGGFNAAFYRAYNASWPLDAGYAVRRDLYNLYHVLNHFNLFGGGYGRQAQGLIKNLLSELA